ncbi:MAG: hypothetical protein Kow0042_25510 [Calditrichia bacterium]
MAQTQKHLEALQIALQTEEEGYKLYRSAAKLKANELTTAIFDQLAKDELMHMDLIKRFYAHLKDAGSWGELSEKDKDYQSAKMRMKTIFSKALDDAKKGSLNFTESEKDAYERAVQFEKDGVSLYNRLHQESDDVLAKKFYFFLREMEQEHLELLDNTLQYLQNPDNWYLLQEGWTLED